MVRLEPPNPSTPTNEQPYLGFLDAYPHPAFILTLGVEENGEPTLKPTYTNPAFSTLFYGLSTTTTETTNLIHNALYAVQHHGLKSWILSEFEPTFFLEIPCPSGVVPADVTKTKMSPNLWVCTTVPRVKIMVPSLQRSLGGLPSKGWPTVLSTPAAIPEAPVSVERIMETFDWSSIPEIGPEENWPQSFRTALGLVLESPHPTSLFWGPNLINIYNNSYTIVAGTKHPRIWGESAITAWSEIWAVLEPSVRTAQSGKAVGTVDGLLFLERLTEAYLPEESYLTWSYVPIFAENGSVGGFMNHVFDTTTKVIAQRRMNLLRDVIAETIMATTPSEFGDSTILALSKQPYSYDISFATLYLCTTDDLAIESEQAAAPSAVVPVSFKLSGSIAIPEGHWSIPESVVAHVGACRLSTQVGSYNMRTHERSSSIPSDTPPRSTSHLDTTEPTDFPWAFVEALNTRQVIHMENLDASLVDDFERRGWGDKPREAVVIPIGFADQMVPSAILVLGINTRRPYDMTYKGDIDIMRMTLSSTLHATLSREAEVKRARRLAELDAAKTALFSNASHELRTPLTLIGGPLEDSINRISDGIIKQNLKMALRNVNRLTRLVDSLMDFSKLAAKKLEGQFRPVQLGIFTADLASLFRNPVEKGGLTYNVWCDFSSSQPMCYIDPDFWEKIVFNLIGNAFKFTLHGSISVNVAHTANNAILTVEDTGHGIPQSDLDKIFERFHRVQSVPSRSYEGTGIGLSLTKELIALHGGTLSVESNDGKRGPHGTKFTVTIPLGKAHLSRDNIYEENAAPIQQGKHARGFLEEAYFWSGQSHSTCSEPEDTLFEEVESPQGNGQQLGSTTSTIFFEKDDVVLLVDDNSDMRRYVKHLLSRYCKIVEAGNGEDALRIAQELKPNIVLSDVMMPIMDGFGLLNGLRSRRETMHIPIVLLTAKSGDDSRIEGLLSGADDYLVKPFKGTELIARVHLQIQLGKKRAELEEKFIERTMEIQQLSELSPVAIFRVDQKGSVTYVNPRWYDITGHAHSADLDRWIERIYSEDRDAVVKWWREACEDERENETLPTIDFRWVNDKWCQGQFMSIGKRGALGAFTDVSEQKKIEDMNIKHALEKEQTARKRAEEAEERQREAEERRRGQELLIDVTSHELRQPVSAILNCSALVRANLSTLYDQLSSSSTFKASPSSLKAIREDLDALDAIYQCGLAQERIANDVLSLSRMQLNVLSIIPVEFNLTKEISRIVALFHNESKMKKILLDVRLGDSIEQLGVEFICSDKSRFAQVVTNLLSNAIKFTDTSTTKRDIVVSVDVGLDKPIDGTCIPPPTQPPTPGFVVAPNMTIYIYVSVTDSGPGLAPEDLSLLFQRFQQGSNSHDVFGGSGLGLFVSRQLCSLMGGRIEVSSPPGKGATFRFFIEAMTSTSLISTPTSLVSSALQTNTSIPRPLHILITEDNLINQTVLNRQLTKVGCITTLASNGRQAIDVLCSSTKPIDAILMDVEMPVMDGLSAVREIRRLEATGRLPQRHPVYALTGNAREGQVQNIREAGMDDVIIKPYRLDALLAKLRSSTT